MNEHNPYAHLVEQYTGEWDEDDWELMESLVDAFSDFAYDAGEEISSDAAQQFIQDANEACEVHGLPRDERADFISAAVFWAAARNGHTAAQSFNQQLGMMYSL